MSIWQQVRAYLSDYYTWNGSTGLPRLALTHLVITFAAVAIAVVVAMPLGVWLGHRRRGGPLVTVVANATRSVPTYGLLVLFAGIVAIGVGNRAAILALAVFAIAPLLTNAYTGVADVDPDVVESARGMGMSSAQILRRVELPLALPLLAAGFRTAAVQTCATATLVAFVGGGGLGSVINLGNGLGPAGYGELISGAVAVALLTIALEAVLALLQASLTPGTRSRALLARLPRPGSRAVITD
jgi:osmoprotectant transport system permease protein